jgi:hypothetical protein
MMTTAKTALAERWRGRDIEICTEISGEAALGDRLRRDVVEILSARGLTPRVCGFEDEREDAIRFRVRMRTQSAVEGIGTAALRFVCRPTIQLTATHGPGSAPLLSAELAGDAIARTGRTPQEALEAALRVIQASLEDKIVELVGF